MHKRISVTNGLYKIKSQAYINIKIREVEFNTSVLIVQNLIHDVILGIDRLVKMNAILILQKIRLCN